MIKSKLSFAKASEEHFFAKEEMLALRSSEGAKKWTNY